jgi:hypothetical protein
MHASRRWIITLLCGLLAACSPAPVPATPTTTPPMTATDSPPAPTLTAVPVMEEAALPDPPFRWLAVVPPGTVIEEWSPDGQWLVYSTPTDVHLVNAANGETCAPVDLTQRTDDDLLWAWLPDSRLLLIDPITLHASAIPPCAGPAERAPIIVLGEKVHGVLAHSADYRQFVVKTADALVIYDSATDEVLPIQIDPALPVPLDYAWSAQGTYLAMSDYLPDTDGEEMYTSIVEAATGQIIQYIEWTPFLADPLRGPDWVGEGTLIFAATGDGLGPLMLPLGGEVTQISTDIFGLDCALIICTYTFVWEAAHANGHMHLLHTDMSTAHETHLSLYHMDSGEIETLSDWDRGEFSPDGTQLLLWHGASGPDSDSRLGVRAVDPPGSAVQPLPPQPVRALWHPDSEHVIIQNAFGIEVRSLIDGSSVQIPLPEIPLWLPFQNVVSPDGRWLLLMVGPADTAEMDLYALMLPE